MVIGPDAGQLQGVVVDVDEITRPGEVKVQTRDKSEWYPIQATGACIVNKICRPSALIMTPR